MVGEGLLLVFAGDVGVVGVACVLSLSLGASVVSTEGEDGMDAGSSSMGSGVS